MCRVGMRFRKKTKPPEKKRKKKLEKGYNPKPSRDRTGGNGGDKIKLDQKTTKIKKPQETTEKPQLRRSKKVTIQK